MSNTEVDARRVIHRLTVTGLLLWGMAGLLYSALLLTFGDRPVYVHVRWAPGVDAAARQRLEQQYRLLLPELREGRTFGYALTDRSRVNVRSLVLDPSVEDTAQIHRTKFRVGYFAPRLPYVTSRPWMPTGLEVLTALSSLAGFRPRVSIGLALLGIAAPARVRGPVLTLMDAFLDPLVAGQRAAARLESWVAGRIPPASAESVAVFRIVLGTALLIYFIGKPVVAAWAASPQTRLYAPPEALWIFTAAPWVVEWIRPWLVFWSVLFVVGAMSRTAFVMLTIGAVAWGVVYTTQITYHTVCAPLMMLVFLTWSRWGDAWSVDAWLRRNRRPHSVAQQEYGYTVWIPSLILGVVFLAAAVAKLWESGLAWILNGTVKYHFLSDSPDAMVDWGLWVGPHPWVAVFLSFSAIAIESVAIVGICSRAYRYRLAAGCAAFPLMLGFALFQGLSWPLWWMMLL